MAGSFRIDPIDLYSAAGLTSSLAPNKPEEPEQGLFGDTIDALQMGAANTVGGMMDFVGADGMARSFRDIGDSQLQQMSQSGRESLQKEFFKRDEQGSLGLGEAATDLDAYLLNLASAVGGMAVTLPLGGALGAATKTGSMVGMGATGGAAATGMQAEQARREVFEMDDNVLRESPKYAEVMSLVDQQFADSSLEEKHQIAKASLAEMVASDVKTDPKTLLANFAGSALADPIIGRALTGARIAKGGIRAGAFRGLVAEGGTEAGQAGVSQYSMNEILQPLDNRDLSEGVTEAALTEGILGGIIGAGAGSFNRGPTVEVKKGNAPVKPLTSSPSLDEALNSLENNVTGSEIVIQRPAATAPNSAQSAAAGERERQQREERDWGLFETPTVARDQYGTEVPTDMGRVGDNLIFNEAIANRQNVPVVDDLLGQARAQAEADRQQQAEDEASAAVRAAFGDAANTFRQINQGTGPVQTALAGGRAPSSADLTAQQMVSGRQEQADLEAEQAAQATSAAFADAARTTKMQSDRWQRRMPAVIPPAMEGEVVGSTGTDVVPSGRRQNWDDLRAGRTAYLDEENQVVVAGQDPSFNPDAPAPQGQVEDRRPPATPAMEGEVVGTGGTGLVPVGKRVDWDDLRTGRAAYLDEENRVVVAGQDPSFDPSAPEAQRQIAVNLRASGKPFNTGAEAMASGAARSAKAEGADVVPVQVEGGFGWADRNSAAPIAEPTEHEQASRRLQDVADKAGVSGDFNMSDVERIDDDMEAEAAPVAAPTVKPAADMSLVKPYPKTPKKKKDPAAGDVVVDAEGNEFYVQTTDNSNLNFARGKPVLLASFGDDGRPAVHKGFVGADSLDGFTTKGKFDSPPESVPKKTRASLLNSKPYKDAVKWAADKDYVVEITEGVGGWSFNLKKSEPEASKAPASTSSDVEGWAMSMDDYVDQEFRKNQYYEEYLKEPELAEPTLEALRKKWVDSLKERATTGRISTPALDSYVREFGMDSLQSTFRGVMDAGAKGYEPSAVRVWDRTYAQVLAAKKRGEFVSTKDVRAFHRRAIIDAIQDGQNVPQRVLKDYPELSGETDKWIDQLEEHLMDPSFNSRESEREIMALSDRVKAAGGDWYLVMKLLTDTIVGAEGAIRQRYVDQALTAARAAFSGVKLRKEAMLDGVDKAHNPVSMQKAKATVDDVLSKLGDLRGITVRIVSTQDDVADVIGPVVAPDGLSLSRAKGYYDPSKKEVVLITENLDNATDVRSTLLHELLAHGGLDMVLGKDASMELLNKIVKTRTVPSFKKFWADVDKNYPELDDIGKAEEIFAKFTETEPEPGPVRFWWNNLVNTVKRMLSAAGLWTSDMTREDMRDALAAIRDGFREKRATINTSTTTRATRNEVRQAAETGRLSDTGAVRRRQDSLAEDSGQKPVDQSASGKTPQSERESDGSLKGLPRRVKLPSGQQIYAKHFKTAADAAKAYMESKGLRYAPHSEYAKADPERAVRIAAAYDMMVDDPFNPEVRASYDAMAKETLEQFQFALDAGLVVEFYPTDSDGNIVDPYPDGPRMATEDVVNNNHLYVYPTADGYGGAGIDPDAAEINPMLADSGFTFGPEPALVNDVFRAVHDYFGHVKEGVGFRADGEENAWQSHAAMYSPLARRAMTTETRGQNSWLNYGPYGGKNRSAKAEDTIFAEQKIGLLPDWVMEEGALWSEPESAEAKPKLSKTRNYETMATPEVDEILKKAHAGVMDKARDALKGSGIWDKVKANWTASLTLGQLAEVFSKLFPSGALKEYNDVYQQYVADVQTAATDASFIANEIQQWASGNKEEADAMFEMAHDATIYGIDADPQRSGSTPLPLLEQKLEQLRTELSDAIAAGTRPREVTSLRKEIKAVKEEIKDFEDAVYARRRAELQARFNALSPEAQKHYRDLRRAYERRRQEAFSVQRRELDRMAERAKADKNAAAYAATMKARKRLSMEQQIAHLSGPYFPLTRFGDYFTDLRRPDGERVFLMHESESEMVAAVKAFEEAGWSIERKGKTAEFMREDGMSSEVLDQLSKIVENSELEPDQVDGLKDQMFQLYLQYLPTRSIRKNLIHRKNVRGFSQDAVRAFALSMSKSSNQIARLKHMPAFTQALRDVNGQVRDYERNGNPSDAVKSRYLLEELRKRHENIMNPTESKVAQAITGLGFTWLLGLSPAAAVINLTQTATIAAPVMSAKLGVSLPKAMALLTRELKNMQLAKTRSGERLITLRNSAEVQNDPILRAAYNQLEKMGVIDLTRAHDLVGISETGGFQYGGKFHAAMSFVSKFFHNAEVINREVTAIAIFKQVFAANVAKGMTDSEASIDAIKVAADLTRQAHFDYSSGNRARFMQGNAAKVAFQFKQYSQQMTYYLIRNAWRSLPWSDLTVQERKEARAQLFGTLMTTGFIGGLSALPLSMIYAIINAVVPDDEDEKPFDAKQEFYTFLAQNFGKDLANKAIYGAGGAGLSSRIQLNDLWLRDPSKNLEGAAVYGNYVLQLLGPVAGGIIPGMVQGATLLDEGQYQKGVEKMIPKAFKDISVSERYADEGATNLRGDVLKEDFNFLELFLQANGLADSEVTARYEENAALKGVEKALKKRRQTLMDRYYDAKMAQDNEALTEVNEAITRFNQKNPTIRLDRRSLMTSMRTRMKRTEETSSGLYLDKKLRYLEEEIDWL